MMGHKICFYGEVWIVIPKLSLLPLLIWCTGISACSLCHVLSHFNKFLSSANKYLFEKKDEAKCYHMYVHTNVSQFKPMLSSKNYALTPASKDTQLYYNNY